MPIFEYECKRCGHFEEFLLKKPTKKKCPQCKKVMVRLMGAVPAHFKGSGFYHTDYRKPRNGIVEKELAKHGIPY